MLICSCAFSSDLGMPFLARCSNFQHLGRVDLVVARAARAVQIWVVVIFCGLSGVHVFRPSECNSGGSCWSSDDALRWQVCEVLGLLRCCS